MCDLYIYICVNLFTYVKLTIHPLIHQSGFRGNISNYMTCNLLTFQFTTSWLCEPVDANNRTIFNVDSTPSQRQRALNKYIQYESYIDEFAIFGYFVLNRTLLYQSIPGLNNSTYIPLRLPFIEAFMLGIDDLVDAKRLISQNITSGPQAEAFSLRVKPSLYLSL